MTSTASAPTHAVPVPTFGKFFLPGPTDVHPDVLEAMIRPMIGHRSGAMEKLLQNVAPKLGALARTARPVFVGTTSLNSREATEEASRQRTRNWLGCSWISSRTVRMVPSAMIMPLAMRTT